VQHKYLPGDSRTREAMLKAIGVSKVEDLFQSIPQNLQLAEPLRLRGPVCEFDLRKELKARAHTYGEPISFLGAGAYRRFIPSMIAPIVGRAEFATSYTPYQPEVSQGNLQAMFEVQSMMAGLTGMEVANGSMYEGGTATAEAVMMATRLNPKAKRVLVSSALHPEYLECIKTYLRYQDTELVEIGLTPEGQTDLAAWEQAAPGALCSVLPNVNFYGVIEDQAQHGALCKQHKLVNIAVVVEMTSLGLLAAPGEFGADIVTGEGQSLGLPLSFGGPYLGVFATLEKHMRKMPGRLSGMTQDKDGKRAFCLTLSTREQHIRREKATSNICSNQQLCALWVAMYLSLLGKDGLKELAQMNYSKAKAAKAVLAQVPGVKLRHPGPHYNEFVLDLPKPAVEVFNALDKKGILAGVPLAWHHPKDERGLLVNLTEVNRSTEVQQLATALQEVL